MHDDPSPPTPSTDRPVAVPSDGLPGGPPVWVALRRPPGAGRAELRVLLAVALGGGLGAPIRHGLGGLMEAGPGDFPWATLAVNVTGSFALGVVLALILERFPSSRYLRPFVATGFLGSYTTYSTFAVETHLLVEHGGAALAAAYAAASLVAGLTAAWGGVRTARFVPLPDRGATR